jgi:hypothetical protein
MKCVVKIGDQYLKGNDTSHLDLVDDLWKARVYANIGAAKNSIIALRYEFNNRGWKNPKVVEVEIYEKGTAFTIEGGYF